MVGGISLIERLSEKFRQASNNFEFFRQLEKIDFCRNNFDTTRMAKRKAAAVSMDPDFEAQAKERARALGFSTFSAYVNQLIRRDLMERGSMIVAEQSGNYNLQIAAHHLSGGAPESSGEQGKKANRGTKKERKR